MNTDTRYELWHEGRIEGPLSGDELEARWLAGSLPVGALWRRRGAQEFRLPEELAVELADSSPPPAPAAVSDEPPADYLDRVRQHSNYRVLRGLIDLGAGIVLVGSGMVLFVTVSMAVSGSSSRDENNPLWIISGALMFCLALAVRQGLLLVIDLADMVAEQGRRKG